MTTFTHEPPDEPPSQQPNGAYPATLHIDYVDTPRDRLTVFFRIITMIPIVFLLGSIGGGSFSDYDANGSGSSAIYSGAAVLFLPVLLMIVFRQKYPRWWFDFNLAMLNFSTRVGAYVGLLTDEYPSTDEEQGVHITLEYPDASQLNRWLPLVKWLLAIPHYVVLFFLYIVAVILIILSWFAILLSGKFPRGIHDYLVGVTRWTLRVEAYALFLTTDKYPPFSLE
jgi:hypothetical protein